MDTIYDEKSISEHSKIFSIPKGANQITLTAFGLTEGDCIHINMVALDGGSRSYECNCIIVPASGGNVIGEEPLRCNECDGWKYIVKLTPDNPVVVLNAPQQTPLRGEYHNTLGLDHIGEFIVFARAGTNTTLDILAGQSGCVPGCEEYVPTFGLPDCGVGFSTTDKRDPQATTEIVDCNGDVVAYIYPNQSIKASVPVYDCSGSTIGYALPGTSPDCSTHFEC